MHVKVLIIPFLFLLITSAFSILVPEPPFLSRQSCRVLRVFRWYELCINNSLSVPDLQMFDTDVWLGF